MIDYEIVKEKKKPENGPTQVICYDVEAEINGETVRKGFNLEPEQDIHGHVNRWLHSYR